MPPFEDLEQPEAGTPANTHWGSDAMAEMLRRIGLKYVALNPGASYRGLHDSIVNRLGNRAPQMILCLHEEHAVAIAHGYAKVAGEPMGAILHSNVGLLHGTMAIFNAYSDRVPVLVFGATGPVDAAKRRPWIDWLHTAQDQGALVRPYVKWDDQPGSVAAAMESIMRASVVSRTLPAGPTYVCFDAALQEQRLDDLPEFPDVARHAPPPPPRPTAESIAAALSIMQGAKTPLIMMGRFSRDPLSWRRRIALAEKLNARVVTDIKAGAAFPTDHPLHVNPPGYFLAGPPVDAVRDADAILGLDWIDLGGSIRQARGPVGFSGTRIVNASIDFTLHNGWNKEHQVLPTADAHMTCDADTAVKELCAALGIADSDLPPLVEGPCAPVSTEAPEADVTDIKALGAALGEGLKGEKVCLIRVPLGWDGSVWHFRHPLDFLGADGGGGIGSGPGMAIGAALALHGSDRLPVAVIGDGDFMMANSAIWTACHYRIPLLFVIANNNSFYNDEVHQERVAKERSRPVGNKWIGQRVEDPDIDLAKVAEAQGALGFGPLRRPKDIAKAIREGVREVRENGRVVVIDARVTPGYSQAMNTSMSRKD